MVQRSVAVDIGNVHVHILLRYQEVHLLDRHLVQQPRACVGEQGFPLVVLEVQVYRGGLAESLQTEEILLHGSNGGWSGLPVVSLVQIENVGTDQHGQDRVPPLPSGLVQERVFGRVHDVRVRAFAQEQTHDVDVALHDGLDEGRALVLILVVDARTLR